MTQRDKGWARRLGLAHPGQKDSRGLSLGMAHGVQIVENAAVSILLSVVCSVTATQVVFRFILKMPLAWSDEVATFSFVWFALLGSAVAVRENGHIGVDALMKALPNRYRRMIAVGSLFLVQCFLGCLVKFGIDLLRRIGDQRSAGLQIEIFWVYLSLPVSAGLMLLHTLPEMRRLLLDLRANSSLDSKG
jgi:TRAP-type C4-dicarboxylate transport system permease small subunit